MITSNSKLFQASAVYKPFSYPWAVDFIRRLYKKQ